MSNYVTLTPAYGRDYKSRPAVITDWEAGKDFTIQHFKLSGYVNNAQILQLKEDGITHLTFRYSGNTRSFNIKL